MNQEGLRFRDRIDAGRKLAGLLSNYKNKNAVVYALPRGGVPVAKEVARALDCPLDLIIIRKIGHPGNPEYALGAVAEDGLLVVNREELARVDQQWFEAEKIRQMQEARRRRELYLRGRKPIGASGKIAIIVDDGIATGSTMLVAVKKVRQEKPAKIVVAVAVSPKETAARFAAEVDEFVAVTIPEIFWGAIGYYYEDFSQVSDEEVVALLKSD
ncbi:MAG: phosphoribosyltransferase [Deltaproteobacteria bacterium]|nr:phosphoribosyltransferase [Deltaproteobacteria bacterium]MBI4795941.1 phosphoribosyltransferase [Deltaproteobacteria bacterium]